MINDRKVIVVMPAYNAELTLQKTYNEVIAQGIVDEVIVVDDCSRDRTVEIASSLPSAFVHKHTVNRGYGGNQKSCYKLALDHGADVIIMVHPDYQYTPKLIPAMASLISNDLYHFVIGSRILGGHALKGGMPLWKYVANRLLTITQNILLGAKLSEYHSGYRAYSKELLLSIDFEKNSDDFVFDAQMLAQIINIGTFVAEISCPTKYFKEASSINFSRSVEYGFGCLAAAIRYNQFTRRNRQVTPLRSRAQS